MRKERLHGTARREIPSFAVTSLQYTRHPCKRSTIGSSRWISCSVQSHRRERSDEVRIESGVPAVHLQARFASPFTAQTAGIPRTGSERMPWKWLWIALGIAATAGVWGGWTWAEARRCQRELDQANREIAGGMHRLARQRL